MEKKAYSIGEFCDQHGICRATFYNLRKQGIGPRIMKVGGRILISEEAAAGWRQNMESAAGDAI